MYGPFSSQPSLMTPEGIEVNHGVLPHDEASHCDPKVTVDALGSKGLVESGVWPSWLRVSESSDSTGSSLRENEKGDVAGT